MNSLEAVSRRFLISRVNIKQLLDIIDIKAAREETGIVKAYQKGTWLSPHPTSTMMEDSGCLHEATRSVSHILKYKLHHLYN